MLIIISCFLLARRTAPLAPLSASSGALQPLFQALFACPSRYLSAIGLEPMLRGWCMGGLTCGGSRNSFR